jgi:hypothetical protein
LSDLCHPACCHCAPCHSACCTILLSVIQMRIILMNVILMNVILMNVILMNVILLTVIILNAIILNVLALLQHIESNTKSCNLFRGKFHELFLQLQVIAIECGHIYGWLVFNKDTEKDCHCSIYLSRSNWYKNCCNKLVCLAQQIFTP